MAEGQKEEISFSNQVLSLAEFSLEYIRQNFDQFNTAYTSTRDPYVKKNLQFLQKLYSSHFIDELTKYKETNSCFLNRQYFDFLINEYLKVLNTSIFQYEDMDTVFQFFSKMGHSLVKLTININVLVGKVTSRRYSEITLPITQKLISLVPNVQTLKLCPSTECDDDTLRLILSTCKELRELTLDNCPISSKGLEYLKEEILGGRSKLRRLSLEGHREYHEEGVLQLLRDVPSLDVRYKYLSNLLYTLHREEFRNKTLDRVPKYDYSFLNIELDYPTADPTRNLVFNYAFMLLKNRLEVVSALCPRVTKLHMDTVTESEQMEVLARFQNLNEVKIGSFWKHQRFTADEFLTVRGQNLTVLLLRSFIVDVSVLIENCPLLETLFLGNIEYRKPEDTRGSKKLLHLRYLDFEFCEKFDTSTGTSVDLLFKCCPGVRELCLITYNSRLEQDVSFRVASSVERFCQMSNTLRVLKFFSCDIKETLLHHVVLTCAPLRKIILRFCNLDMCHSVRLRNLAKSLNKETIIEFAYTHDCGGERSHNWVTKMLM